MSLLRVGIIGFGYTGRLHLAAWNAVNGAEVAGVAETRPSAQDGCPAGVRWFHEYADLLASDIDAVSVCLPTSLHCRVVQDALAAGKHVLVEKPIATTLEDAEAMIEAANRADKRLFVGMTHRFYPEVLAAKKLVDDGAIGEIVMIRDCILEHFGFLDSPGWYFDRDIAGGGVVLSSGIHMVDRVLWFAGEVPTAVSGTTSHAFFRRDVEDAAQMNLRFASGRTAQIAFGFLPQPHPLVCDLELTGTKGSIVVHTWQGYEHRTAAGVKVHHIYESESHAEKVSVGLKGECEEFRDAIREGRDPRPSVEESTRALRVILGFYRAAETGKTLLLEEPS